MRKSWNKGTALVTGASSGIGAAYAEKLARRGYDLLLVARDEARLNELAARLTNLHSVKVSVFKADLTNAADLLSLEQRFRADPSISLVVNNAGLGPQGKLIGGDINYLDQMIALNVTAVNRLAVAAANVFAARGAGGIINIASVVALLPEAFSGTYSGTKAFVLNLTQALASELEGKGVQVQAVLPGLTRTEIFERAGVDIESFDPNMVMSVDDLVDAALAGFDQHELVTIPSLPNVEDWKAAVAARVALAPNLSRNVAAVRYREKVA